VCVCVCVDIVATSGAAKRALHAGLGDVGHVITARAVSRSSNRASQRRDVRRRATTSLASRSQHGVHRHD